MLYQCSTPVVCSIIFGFGCVVIPAPVNQLRDCDSAKTFWKEGVSFEHQFDSRLDPSYPHRGKVNWYNVYMLPLKEVNLIHNLNNY